MKMLFIGIGILIIGIAIGWFGHATQAGSYVTVSTDYDGKGYPITEKKFKNEKGENCITAQVEVQTACSNWDLKLKGGSVK